MSEDEKFWHILLKQCQSEQMVTGIAAAEQSSSAIVRLADFLLNQAAAVGASDLHIEPVGQEVRFRCRCDGLLQELPYRLPADLAARLSSRIKVMAGMDIAVRNRPQDGSFVFAAGKEKLDIRVAAMPVSGGEMLVLRLMNMQEDLLSLSQLGFSRDIETSFRKLIHRPSGLIIVTGPMNSGKTTTLYAALRELNAVERNFITLEDPIERHIAGINQVQLNPKAGLTYASGLRAILRQDAQGILLGEIRDEETAMMAVRMALTGHLLLTTLHTENAAATVFRLLEMGVPPYLLAATLTGVLAQRLVRRSVDGTTDKFCGRLAIHELMVVDKSIREAILTGQSQETLQSLACAGGMETMQADGENKAVAHLTTPEEVRRVLYGS